jgi:6-phosphogluconolactonase
MMETQASPTAIAAVARAPGTTRRTERRMIEATTRWHTFDDPRDLAQQACARILAAAGEAIAMRGRFDIVLAGGNTPRGSYALLRSAVTDWHAWHAWFGDERCPARMMPTATA